MSTSALWDPYRTFDVNPNAVGFTCIGYARTQGRRCRNPIAIANRDAACRLLDCIAATTPQQTGLLEGYLGRLAPMVLCRRWHQDQADEIVDKWLRDATGLSTGFSVANQTLFPSSSFNLRAGASQPVPWPFNLPVSQAALPLYSSPPANTFLSAYPSTLVAPQRSSNAPVLPPQRATPTLPVLPPAPVTTPQRFTVSTLPSPPETTPQSPFSLPPVVRSNAPSPMPIENHTPPPGQSTSATTVTATATSTATTVTASTTTTPTSPATATSVPRFDPYSTLDVSPDSRGFSCVGHSTREGGRCSKLISSRDRITACALLDRIAARSLSKRKLVSLLERLAPMVLCKRRHQGQAERVVAEWVRKVDEAAVVIRRTAEEERERDASPRDGQRAEDESEESSESSDDSDNDSDDSSDNNDDTDTPPHAPSPPEASTTAAVAPTPPAQPTTLRKPIEGECPICYSDLQEPGEALVWCRAQCGQNFHQECASTWAAAGGSRATCAYCRAAWVD